MTHWAYAYMDAGLCGIFNEEAACLREKDEEYLKTVNIVPIKPAIYHHKGEAVT